MWLNIWFWWMHIFWINIIKILFSHCLSQIKFMHSMMCVMWDECAYVYDRGNAHTEHCYDLIQSKKPFSVLCSIYHLCMHSSIILLFSEIFFQVRQQPVYKVGILSSANQSATFTFPTLFFIKLLEMRTLFPKKGHSVSLTMTRLRNSWYVIHLN